MPDESTRALIAALEERYPNRIARYGSHPGEEHGVGFRITGVAAVFSALTLDGSLPPNEYDVQIESFPPGRYIYIARASLPQFLELIERYFGPEESWPTIGVSPN